MCGEIVEHFLEDFSEAVGVEEGVLFVIVLLVIALFERGRGVFEAEGVVLCGQY